MNKELLKLKKLYRKSLPNETKEIAKVFLTIFSVKYSISESDFQRKLSTCVSLSVHFNDSQCISECPLSDKLLVPLYSDGSGTARLIYKLLLEISDETPSVTYAPILFPLISFLSLYLTEIEIKNAVVTLLSDIEMVPSSTNDWNVHCHLLAVLGRRYASKELRALRSSSEADQRQIFFWPHALWALPLTFLGRVLACYFVEGGKVLLRAGLVIWKESLRRHRSARGPRTGPFYWREAMATTAANIGRSFTPQSFLDRMFRIRNFSQAAVARGKRGLAGTLASGEWISPTSSKGYVAFKTKDANPSGIVTHGELIDIVRNLNPYLAQINKPVQLFSTARQGYSLRSLYNVAQEHSCTLLIVETVLGEVIGAYCADPWSLKNRAEINRFYGKGECFVFKVRPRPLALYRWVQDRDNVLANMFQRATLDSLEVGGGSGGAAIRIGADLGRGSSHPSATFDSPCLTECSHQDFLVKTLELLTFQEAR